MKKTTITICLLIAAFVSKSQNTTIEEFNYLARGLAVQEQSGLDMKRGYQLVDIKRYHSNDGRKSTEVRTLMRLDNSTERIAGYSIVIKYSNGKIIYIGMPALSKIQKGVDQLWINHLQSVLPNNQDRADATATFSFYLGDLYENALQRISGVRVDTTSKPKAILNKF